MTCEVIVDIANSEVDRVFDYVGADGVFVGSRVLVPFGARKIEGFAIGQKEHSDVDDSKLKSIDATMDDFVAVTSEMLELMRFMTERLHIRLIDALRLFVTAQMKDGRIGELINSVVFPVLTLEEASERL